MVKVMRITAKIVAGLVAAGSVGLSIALFGFLVFLILPPQWQHWRDFALAEKYIARVKSHRAQHPCYPTHAEAGIPNTESGHVFYEHGCDFFKIIVSVNFDEHYSFNSVCDKWRNGFGDGCEP